MTVQILEKYGMRQVGTIAIDGDRFIVTITDQEAVMQERVVYAFLVGEEIMRVGSSKAKLRARLNDWRRDVSNALLGQKSPTPEDEAREWRQALADRHGSIYARVGTIVETPVGRVSAYLAEEAALIERHRPRFCRR